MILMYELSDIVAEDQPPARHPCMSFSTFRSRRLSFSFFVGLFVFLVILIQLHVPQFAYAKLGLSSGAVLLVLLASLIGSYFNIPNRRVPGTRVQVWPSH